MRAAAALALCAAAAMLLLGGGPARRRIELPPGVVEFDAPMRVPSFAEVVGRGTTVRASAAFRGRALFEVRGAASVVFRGFTVDGNRGMHEQRTGLPPYNVPFSQFTLASGILAENASNIEVRGVHFRNIAGFSVIASRSRRVTVAQCVIEDSGSRDVNGRNNATGGVLFEGGTQFFKVVSSSFRNVRGNAVWTHSRAADPRNAAGFIGYNRFDTIGRDAIQIGHATRVRVANNTGVRIGYPAGEVDAVPVGIDTAGNVDASQYAANRFEDIRGKCIDLDGFHHGDVRGNVCAGVNGGYAIVMNNSNPEMRPEGVVIAGNEVRGARWGAVFVIGSGNRVESNRFTHLNTARCGCVYSAGDPELLNAGIYLGRGAERPAPARGNTIRDNLVTGFGMDRACLAAAPGVALADNDIHSNRCLTSPHP